MYTECLVFFTNPDGTVAMSSANGLDFKRLMGKCKATTPSSLSLTSNRVTNC